MAASRSLRRRDVVVLPTKARARESLGENLMTRSVQTPILGL